jgi:hypothetical protein
MTRPKTSKEKPRPPGFSFECSKKLFSGNGSKVVAETIVNTNGRFITVNVKNYEGSRISDTSSGVLECNVKL